jgi:N-acetylglucosaminyldiphosphoundecaprenol N-acetyl-beta-D-mannosaminyltransferase
MPLSTVQDHKAEAMQAGAAPLRPRVDFQRDVVCLLGLPFDVASMTGAVAQLRSAAAVRRRCFISTPNLNFVMAARSDDAFRDSVLHSDLSLVDGMPLVWMARLLGLPIRERVSGAGLFEHLVAHPEPSISVYFFGGPPGVAQAACEQVNRQPAGVRCVGFDTPGFGSVEEMSTEDEIGKINKSEAQFVVVALGAKKGQAWIEHNRGRLTAPLLCHLGAVVNFVAGSVRRAPPWLQACGLEWLWRVKEEPGLWRRYWDDGCKFVYLLVTRVLPYAVLLRWQAAVPQASQDAAVSVTQMPNGTLLELRGAWSRTKLQPLRQALAQVSPGARSLVVVMKDVSSVDSAFVGLMLLARGAFSSTGSFTLRDASKAVRRTFRFNGAEFLLAASASGAA